MTGRSETQSDTELEGGTVVLEETDNEFAYDDVFNSLAFIFTEKFDNGTIRVGRNVLFFDRGVGYFIEDNQGEQTCVRLRIPRRFPRKCVPENAAFKGNVTYGDNALTGHVWELNEEMEQGLVGNFTYYVPADYCVPIVASYVIQDFRFSPPRSEVATTSFSDINLGICDRERFFHVPDDCPQDSVSVFGKRVMDRIQMMQKFFRSM